MSRFAYSSCLTLLFLYHLPQKSEPLPRSCFFFQVDEYCMVEHLTELWATVWRFRAEVATTLPLRCLLLIAAVANVDAQCRVWAWCPNSTLWRAKTAICLHFFSLYGILAMPSSHLYNLSLSVMYIVACSYGGELLIRYVGCCVYREFRPFSRAEISAVFYFRHSWLSYCTSKYMQDIQCSTCTTATHVQHTTCNCTLLYNISPARYGKRSMRYVCDGDKILAFNF